MPLTGPTMDLYRLYKELEKLIEVYALEKGDK